MGKQVSRIIIATCLVSFLACCGCLVVTVLNAYYGPIIFKDNHWSDLSTLDNKDDVKATIEEHLTVGQSTRAEVSSFLAQKNVKECTFGNKIIVCTTTHRDSNLIFVAYYELRFYFDDDRLSQIEVFPYSEGF
jgi:hypothetical protein